MSDDSKILIKNIYYMLSYAFHTLKQTNYDEVKAEEFEHIHDLFAVILAKGIAQQLKQGLHREYITRRETLPLLRGKLDINETIKNRLQKKHVLACEFDDLSANNLYNQILKTTAIILLKQPMVKKENRVALKKVILFFSDIDIVDPYTIKWDTIRFQRSNQNYQMLLNICRFILEGLLLSTEKGVYKMAVFLDEKQMSRLFERFVLQYYKLHHPKLRPTSSQIKWAVDDDETKLLPVMQSDIMLHNNDLTLIIDTKYYSCTMQHRVQYDSHTLHSHNLYQIYTYVKNYDTENSGDVGGLLLYAKTNETIAPDCSFRMKGNRIDVRTLDLNTDWDNIKNKLDGFARNFFGNLL